MHYRKVSVNSITIPHFGVNFITQNLFPNSEIPAKIHFMIVDTLALNGSYSKVNVTFHLFAQYFNNFK